MVTRKKKSARKKTKIAFGHGAVAETVDRLVTGRKARRRKPGDGEGVDIGIANCFGITIEEHLSKLSPAERPRMHDHIKSHVDAAMKPLLKLMQRDGADEADVRFFADIGPNMFRTIIEYFEEKD